MLRALWAAASGMMAQQANLDLISHNLANVNTPGFKASRVELGDVVWTPEGLSPLVQPGLSSLARQGLLAVSPAAAGAGVRVLGARRSLLPGQMEETGQPLGVSGWRPTAASTGCRRRERPRWGPSRG